MSIDYAKGLEEWFKREKWNKKEAACLLLGTIPVEKDQPYDLYEWYEGSPWQPDWGYETWTKNVYDLEFILSKEARLKDDVTDSRLLQPMCVAQWAYENQKKYHIDDRFIRYITDKNESFKVEECHWIDRDYKYWLDVRHWTREETINLLTGYPVKISNHAIIEFPSSRDNFERAFELAISANELSFSIKGDDEKYWRIDCMEAIKWARARKFSIPYMLEVFCSELYPDVFDGVLLEKSAPGLRQSQICKQVCQAVAKTLWSIYPDFTIEQIKSHHAIQEFAGGKVYNGKNTLRDWISEVDPRPAESKRGRKKRLPANAS